jgi:hypothetical protein
MMIQFRRWPICVGAALFGTTFCTSQGFAQANLPVATAGEHVVIKREACRVVEPSKYRVPLSIEAIQTVTLVAPFDATIKTIAAKANSKIPSQGEVIRLDNTIQKLNLNRAALVVKMAMAELKQSDKDESAKELAQLKLDLAKVDETLAQSILEHRGSIRQSRGSRRNRRRQSNDESRDPRRSRSG